jgi:hypothetical protein
MKLDRADPDFAPYCRHPLLLDAATAVLEDTGIWPLLPLLSAAAAERAVWT